MRLFKTLMLFLLVLLAACAPGQGPAIPTNIPPALVTRAVQAPTFAVQVASTAEAAINAALTQAAPVVNTAMPAAGTAAANALSTWVPSVQTAAAPIVATLIPQAAPGAATPPASAATIEIRLSEKVIAMPTTLPAGPATLKVSNVGTMPHNLEIKGMGIDQKWGTLLNPGESQTLSLTLIPGAYQVFCPVGNHADQGESVNVTITPR